MPLSYDRSISDVLLQGLLGGPAHELLQRHHDDPRLDLQLRGGTDNRVTLYCGLTKALDLRERKGLFRVRVRPAWAVHGPGLPVGAMTEAELAAAWPGVSSYLDSAIPAMLRSRYFRREGTLQAQVSRLQNWTVFDREVLLSVSSEAEKQAGLAALRAELQLTGESGWGATPALGDECDAVALDKDGRLLAIEVKPGSAGSGAATWVARQAMFYALRMQTWIDQDAPAAVQSVDRLLEQRVALGLTPSAPPQLDTTQVVRPVVVMDGPPSKEVLRRLLVIRDQIIDSAVAESIDVMFLAHGELTKLD